MTQQTQTETINLATDVLVVGAGMTGVKAATEIAANGYRVLLIDQESGLDARAGASVADLDGNEQAALNALMESANSSTLIDVMTATRMDGAAGVPGDFRVWLSGKDDIVEKSVGAIVVASELVTCPLHEAYGVNLSDTVISQSQLEAMLRDNPASLAGKSLAFMVGLAQDGNPLVLERVLKSVLAVEAMEDTSVYVFAGDLKVAEDGLERLYLECRDKGAMYLKLTEIPAVAQEGKSLTIAYDDPVLQRKVELAPDIIVVEEAIGADQVNAAVAEMLNIDVGSMGFLQTDNVHRYPVSTNRQGIFVVGGSRVKKRYGALMDAQNAAIRVRDLLGDGSVTVPANKAILDTGKCTFCLTCFRCCPHGAIYWTADNKPVISKVACQACGICASECPMDAIQIGDFNDADMIDQVTRTTTEKIDDAPTIVAFCCQNSGLEAARMAELFGMPLPKGLKTVAVPCAGKVDIDYVMHALAEGADGVVIMACYNGNCKSEKGSLYASWRAVNAQDKLEAIGIAKERIRFATTAANMGADFSSTLMAMEETLKAG
jgi:quinone-modifying oxidoreductase, subunit QmoB